MVCGMRGYFQNNLLLRNNGCIHAFVVVYHTKGRGLCTQSSTTISGRTLGFHTGDLVWRQCQDGLMPVGRHLGGGETMGVCVRCCEGAYVYYSIIQYKYVAAAALHLHLHLYSMPCLSRQQRPAPAPAPAPADRHLLPYTYLSLRAVAQIAAALACGAATLARKQHSVARG